MGFWGSFLLCRSGQPLDEIEAINDRGAGPVWSRAFGSSWQVGQYLGEYILDDARALLEDLGRITGAPTLTGHVLASDCVDVRAYALKSAHFTACLDRQSMANYLEEQGATLADRFLAPDAAVSKAISWANEGGLEPDRVNPYAPVHHRGSGLRRGSVLRACQRARDPRQNLTMISLKWSSPRQACHGACPMVVGPIP